jgi:hypothetical protein
MTCAKTQGFLARHKVTVAAQSDAKKATIKGDATLRKGRTLIVGFDEATYKDVLG